MARINSFLAGLISVVSIVSCAPMEVSTPFDVNEVSFVNRQGTATITGQGFLRQMGGGVVTCAGSKVELIPAGGYATELFTKAFGSRDGGLAGVFVMAPESTPPEFKQYRREAQCDAQGNFTFNSVPNGSYYAVTTIQWYASSRYIPEGGTVGRRVDVAGGRSLNVILTD